MVEVDKASRVQEVQLVLPVSSPWIRLRRVLNKVSKLNLYVDQPDPEMVKTIRRVLACQLGLPVRVP